LSDDRQEPIVELRNVRVDYDGFVALDVPELAFGRGAIGLLGSNGAGKSTLLRTILGFRQPRRGEVRVFGLPVGKNLLAVRQRVGYVPENDVTSPQLSAVSFVSYCGELSGMRRQDAMQATHQVLNYVGLNDERYRPMSTYSLGMRQRVKLAQALVHDPELVFLDEPTNGLDPRARVEMLRLIRELARERGVTVILSTHLLPDVEQVCDQVVVLGRGRVLRQGSLAALLGEAGRKHELGFVGDGEAVRRALEARGFGCEPGPAGRLLVELGPHDTGSDVIAAVTRAGASIRHLEPVQRTLEEVFIAAVQAAAVQAASKQAAEEVTHAGL
jgi:ABC-2 type transport system ATP-binding protein